MTEHDLLCTIIHGQSVLPDEALSRLNDSELITLLCRLEQWKISVQSEWDWRRHTRQEQVASAARRIA